MTSPPSASSSTASAPDFEPGLGLVTVQDRVRMRSQPSTGAESVKYDPVLPLGTGLEAIEGPVAGDGYWWYRVELSEPEQHLTGGARKGWVAVADHDGSPWVDVYREIDPGPPAPAVIAGWPAVRRDSIVLRGTPVEEGSGHGITMPVRVQGLLPGSSLDLHASGRYRVQWVCAVEDASEIGVSIVDDEVSHGTGTTSVTLVVGEDGMARGSIDLVADEPGTPCPAPGRRFTMARRWTDLRVRYGDGYLVLTPPDYESADTF